MKKTIEKTNQRIEKIYERENYVNLSVSDSIKVNLKKDTTYNLNVKIDKAYVDYFNVDIKGDTLHLYMQKKVKYKNPEITVDISAPDIEDIELSENSVLNINNVSFDDLYLELNGKSMIKGNLYTEKININGNNESSIFLSGKSEVLKMEVKDKAKGNMDKFIVNEADLEINGNSKVNINVKNELSAEVKGDSRLNINGNPEIKDVHIDVNSDIKWVK